MPARPKRRAGGGEDSIGDYLENVGEKPVTTWKTNCFIIGEKTPGPLQGIANMWQGYARDAKTGEPIAGASIYVENPRIGVSSDQYGYYSDISAPRPAYPQYPKHRHA